MDTINRRYIWTFFIILLVIMVGAYTLNTMRPPSLKPYRLQTSSIEETSNGKYYTVRDAAGLTIFQTGLAVHVDDRYINENNVEYIIIHVDGLNATASIIQKEVSSSQFVPPTIDPSKNTGLISLEKNRALPVQLLKSAHVVMYHSHSDESYVPTSGKASKPGEGDIYTVGDALTETLQNAGISVTHSRAAHEPHDINAYSRSRRTLIQLLKERPNAAYDIHRDSAPASAYFTTINGVDSSRVMMVVGKSNPNMATSLAYAKRVKARADNLYPGLVRGIFMGRGDYNQDLYPTAMLFEIGTESISLDLAENSARCLGDVLIREMGVR